MVGFENFVFREGIISSLDQYFSNEGDRYSDYMGICTRIRGEIREDQIGGGMVGIYNASITQRLNNLVDRQDIKSDNKPLNQSIPLVLSDGRTYEDLKNELKPE